MTLNKNEHINGKIKLPFTTEKNYKTKMSKNELLTFPLILLIIYIISKFERILLWQVKYGKNYFLLF